MEFRDLLQKLTDVLKARNPADVPAQELAELEKVFDAYVDARASKVLKRWEQDTVRKAKF